MTDIVEMNLRRAAYIMFVDGYHSRTLATEAADKIVRLNAEIERLHAENASLSSRLDIAAQQIGEYIDAFVRQDQEATKLRFPLSEARATGRREEQDVVDKATAWDACNASFQKGRKAGMEEAEKVARQFGDCSRQGTWNAAYEVAAAIRAAMEKEE